MTAALLADLVATWQDVRSATGRTLKRRRMAQLFAALAPEDLRLAATWLGGELTQATLGVGWAGLSGALERLAAPAGPPLTLQDLEASLDVIAATSGVGSVAARIDTLVALFARAAAAEREFLTALLEGALRQGALRSLVIDAVAESHHVAGPVLRRAVMLAGALGPVVMAVARDGAAAAEQVRITPLHPVEPMLAATAGPLDEALAELGGAAAVEWKLDGMRVQVHRLGDEVRVFTRSLREVTGGAPELVADALALPAHSFILDGEILGVSEAGEPLAFQDSMSSLADERPAERPGDRRRTMTRYFDLLYLDGAPLIDAPDQVRRAALEGLVGAAAMPRRIARSAAEIAAFLAEALDQGHEGVVLKSLDAPYAAGRRGASWRKLKVAHTLDLVILAAEWGHGRRVGLLSNLHLGARDPVDAARFWMLGKTFKGLTDAMLRELTLELPNLQTRATAHTVYVRPERLVEIAFDDVQRSTRYDSGMALRFARVKRFRPDKPAEQATTVDEVRALIGRKAR